MPKVFISYRREDTLDVCGRIYDRLELALGAQQVMMDVDTIPAGADFREYLERMVNQCDVFLAVIGPRWAGPMPDGTHRIDDPNDFVRIEVELALKRRIPIIPLLVSGATMPSGVSLSASLAPLAYRNAIVVRPNPDFRRDMERVVKGIEAYVPAAAASPPVAPAPPPQASRQPATKVAPSRKAPTLVVAQPLFGFSIPPRVAAALLLGGGALAAIAFFLPWRVWAYADGSGTSLVSMVSDARVVNELWIVGGAAVLCLSIGILAFTRQGPLPLLGSAVIVAGVGMCALFVDFLNVDPLPGSQPGFSSPLAYHLFEFMLLAAPAFGAALLLSQLPASGSVGSGRLRRILLGCLAAALAGALQELLIYRVGQNTFFFPIAAIFILVCGASTLAIRNRRGRTVMYVLASVALFALPVTLASFTIYNEEHYPFAGSTFTFFDVLSLVPVQIWLIVSVVALFFLFASYDVGQPRAHRTRIRFYLSASAIGLSLVVTIAGGVTQQITSGSGWEFDSSAKAAGFWLALAGLAVAFVGAFALHEAVIWRQSTADATIVESVQVAAPVAAP